MKFCAAVTKMKGPQTFDKLVPGILYLRSTAQKTKGINNDQRNEIGTYIYIFYERYVVVIMVMLMCPNETLPDYPSRFQYAPRGNGSPERHRTPRGRTIAPRPPHMAAQKEFSTNERAPTLNSASGGRRKEPSRGRLVRSPGKERIPGVGGLSIISEALLSRDSFSCPLVGVSIVCRSWVVAQVAVICALPPGWSRLGPLFTLRILRLGAEGLCQGGGC